MPGLLHGVVNLKNVEEIYTNNVLPGASKCEELISERNVMEYTDIFGNVKSVECLIETYCVLKNV